MKRLLVRYWKPGTLVVGSAIVLGSFFQNCSAVHVTDLNAEAEAEAARILALGRDSEKLTAGLGEVPQLKMFFIVDNSGTMKQNQLNLSQSFQALFDASSSESLAKFDATAFLLSTAQRSPALANDRSTLDAIFDKQKNFSMSPIAATVFNSNYRSSSTNFGNIPGDNVGYQLARSSNPSKYSFSAAPVLGDRDNAGNVELDTSIRKLASQTSAAMEADFIKRLAVLNADRIPMVLDNGQYKPEFASVVDSESGLCAVARILRNPNAFISAGQLLAFTIVSDENDNDPAGLSCVDSVTQFDGTEDLVDGQCVQKQTALTYKTTTAVKAADSCKLDGVKQYNFKFTYANTTPTTTVTYNAVNAAAVYKAEYSKLTYKQKVASYALKSTKAVYYTQTCVPVYSDGQQIDTKCTVNASTSTGTKEGDYLGDCYALAKSLNANAVNVDGKKPVCTLVDVSTGSCNPATNANCKVTYAGVDKTVNDILGNITDSAKCLAKAQSYSDFYENTVPVCVSTPKDVAACSMAETNAGCALKSATTYKQVTVNPSGDQTANGCVTYAKTLNGNAVSSAADIFKCQLNAATGTLTQTGSLTFAEVAGADGGNTIATNADCGAVKTLAYNKAHAVKAQIQMSDSCVITGTSAASQTTEALVSDCATQAAARCTKENLRMCSGQLVVGATTNVVSAELPYKTVAEAISCSSKCSASLFGVCDADAASSMTVLEHLQKVYGAATTCAEKTTVGATVETKTAQIASKADDLCEASLTGVPRYFNKTKGPYRSVDIVTDFVAGTMKDANGKDVPKTDLVTYIKNRSSELSSIDPIFSALVRRPGDPLGQGGTYGTDYLKLISETGGSSDSVLSPDYSVALKGLGSIIKNRLIRSFTVKRMRPDQIVTDVYHLPKGTSSRIRLSAADWKQNGKTLELSAALEFLEGDVFEVSFQNDVH